MDTNRRGEKCLGLSAMGLAASLIVTAALSPVARAQTVASADTLQQLRKELAALKAEEAAARAAEQARAQRIDALAHRLAKANGEPVIETPPPAEAGAVETRPVPTRKVAQSGGKETPSFEIYGFAETDYIQDFNRVNQNWDSTLRPSRIPTTAGAFGSDGQSIISVKQSRFGVNASQDIAGRPLNAKFEFDLFGTGVDEGQTTFRLRKVYGSWGPLLAGQTNSVFMDGDTFPNVVDYWGPNGMVFLRTPQIRYTYATGPHEFAVAIEHANNDIDPGNIRLIDPDLGTNIRNDEKIPDLTGHYRYAGDWGHVQLASILRRVGYDTSGTPDNHPKGYSIGWGVNLSSNIKTWDKDVIHLSAVYGEGIATYMNDGGTDLGPRVRLTPSSAPPGVTASFSPDAVPLLGLMFYYDHYWNSEFSTSFGYSQTRVSNTNFQAADAFRVGQYASANLLYTPDPHLLFGAEFLWGEREDRHGATGDDSRLQFTVKYTFSSNDGW